MSTKYIWVTFSKEGIHRYPEAETNPELKDVSFLGHPHRHMFQFKVYIEVAENNREIEFILWKRWLESLYDQKCLSLDYRSCEMMAEELAYIIQGRYPNRNIIIEISEDGENGCRLEI